MGLDGLKCGRMDEWIQLSQWDLTGAAWARGGSPQACWGAWEAAYLKGSSGGQEHLRKQGQGGSVG